MFQKPPSTVIAIPHFLRPLFQPRYDFVTNNRKLCRQLGALRNSNAQPQSVRAYRARLERWPLVASSRVTRSARTETTRKMPTEENRSLSPEYVRTLRKELRSLLSSVAARGRLRFAILVASHSAYFEFPRRVIRFPQDSCRMFDPVRGCDHRKGG